VHRARSASRSRLSPGAVRGSRKARGRKVNGGGGQKRHRLGEPFSRVGDDLDGHADVGEAVRPRGDRGRLADAPSTWTARRAASPAELACRLPGSTASSLPIRRQPHSPIDRSTRFRQATVESPSAGTNFAGATRSWRQGYARSRETGTESRPVRRGQRHADVCSIRVLDERFARSLR
jgi:hypothetical protein